MEDRERIFPYRFLPAPVRSFFLDSGLEDVDLIVKTHGLSGAAADTIDTIQQEVLFGYETVDKVVNLLRTRLGYDEAQARAIALDLIEKRFLPVDAYLQAQAYRVYAALGGNITVVNVRSVGSVPTTVTAVARAVREFAVENLQERQAPRDTKSEPQKSPMVADVITAPTPREQPLAAKVTPAPREQRPLVATVRALDAAMDERDESRKGESGTLDTGLVSGALDPEHELAPPPPMITPILPTPGVGKETRVTSRLKRRRAPAVVSAASVASEPIVSTPIPEEKSAPRQIVSAPTRTVSTLKPHKGSILDVEHEAEVANIVNELKATGASAPRALEHPKIDEIVRKLSLRFPSDDMQKRFRVLVGSRLSGLRTPQEFRAALARSVEKGGLALDAHTLERVLESVEDHTSHTQAQAEEKAKQDKQTYVAGRVKRYDISSSKPTPGDGKTSTPMSTPPKMASSVPSAQRPSTPSVPSAQRPSTADIRAPKKLVGPLEEIARMTIEDFRRIPGSVDDVVQNIREDIHNMGLHDPGERIRAVAVWRQSPLVRQYQAVLAAALSSGTRIEQTLADAQANPRRFTLDEFNAIRALNASLRL